MKASALGRVEPDSEQQEGGWGKEDREALNTLCFRLEWINVVSVLPCKHCLSGVLEIFEVLVELKMRYLSYNS